MREWRAHQSARWVLPYLNILLKERTRSICCNLWHLISVLVHSMIFWATTPIGKNLLRNINVPLQNYTVSGPRIFYYYFPLIVELGNSPASFVCLLWRLIIHITSNYQQRLHTCREPGVAEPHAGNKRVPVYTERQSLPLFLKLAFPRQRTLTRDTPLYNCVFFPHSVFIRGSQWGCTDFTKRQTKEECLQFATGFPNASFTNMYTFLVLIFICLYIV
jgi:hypothetical protein